MNRRVFLASIGLGAAALACGCKPKAPYDLVPVSGTITYQGKPLDDRFYIEIQNEDGSRPSIGRPDATGKFEAIHTNTQKGVKPGKNTIVVYWKNNPEVDPIPEEFQPMFKKYGFTGSEKLTIDISKKETNLEIKFE